MADLAQIREAIRSEHKVTIDYCDNQGTPSCRTIWPFALGYFDQVRIMVAWCELRADFRHFRTDRISRVEINPEQYPRRRQALLKAWRVSMATKPVPATDRN